MGEVDDLVEAAEEHLRKIVRRAILLLHSDTDASRVRRRYLSAAVDLSEEVAVRAVLASQGDVDALASLRLLVGELERLAEEALAELDSQDGA